MITNEQKQKLRVIHLKRLSGVANDALTDINGNRIIRDDCTYEYQETRVTGELCFIINCKPHGHGSMVSAEELELLQW
jgi:hypothetical protein